MARKQLAAAFVSMTLMAVLYVCTLRMPAVKSVSADRMTQTITIQALSGVALQMDACETALQARIGAARLTERGSAGYVKDGKPYRVLGIMLDSEEEVRVMQQKLLGEGLQTELYPCDGRTLTLRVTADAAATDALRAAIHAVDMAAVQPGMIALQLDAQQISPDSARSLAAMLSGELEAAQRQFRSVGGQDELCRALDELMCSAMTAMEPLTSDRTSDPMLAGVLRCAGMTVWFAREDMISRMNRT